MNHGDKNENSLLVSLARSSQSAEQLMGRLVSSFAIAPPKFAPIIPLPKWQFKEG